MIYNRSHAMVSTHSCTRMLAGMAGPRLDLADPCAIDFRTIGEPTPRDIIDPVWKMVEFLTNILRA